MTDLQETSIVYDYGIKQVRVYSTRPAVIRDMIKRLGTEARGLEHKGEFLYIPMEYCRKPSSITRILKGGNEEAAEIETDDSDINEEE